ncbi:alkaline phosphatase [Litchfieldia alkalitelluris]|uniref:alkaline phosphatase n=1 Tax=Litchfieldia alkalitelluris TaxID=304268 RepID=UPI001F2EB462|nr:alkaline phosphatase [Litchfieldia alkalitelluris]
MTTKSLRKWMTFVLLQIILVGSIFATQQPITFAKDKSNQMAQGVAKNVIFLIPDGFSSSYATNYRWFKGDMSMMDPYLVGMHRTYSANTEVTDSAAAGTAMATGVKTNNGMISTAPDGTPVKTILEAAEEHGKSTGLVATSTITHATPAVFASHVASRAAESDIAPQYFETGVDVLLGGGKQFFPDTLISDAQAKGYEYVTDRDSLSAVNNTTKLLGLFAESSLAPELDRETTNQPSLAEMTTKAIEVLNQDKDGFFLMVEGSQIDWAGHGHDAAWAMNDTKAFEDAVTEALNFAQTDKNTLVVIAGDHDTGGMSVGGYDVYDANVEFLHNVTATGQYMARQINAEKTNIAEVVKEYTGIDLTSEEVTTISGATRMDIAINQIVSKNALVGWTSLQHTGVDVQVYAYGPGSDLFRGLYENTAFPSKIAEALNIHFTPTK